MWRADVLGLLPLLLLLLTDLQVIGGVEEKERPAAGMSSEAADIGPPGDSPSSPTPAFSGKLLVVPMDGSHWVTMKAIAQELGRRGHQVTVVMPEVNIRMGPGKYYDTLMHPVPYDKAVIDHLLSLSKEMMQVHSLPFIERITKVLTRIRHIFGFLHVTAESLLFNTTIISHLEQQRFDAVLTDPMMPAGPLIARKLGIPIVNLLRGIPCSLDMKSAGCPSPPSYVPRFFTGYTDKMSFTQRIVNMMVTLVEPLFCRAIFWQFDNMAYDFLGEKVGVAEVLADSDIWLLRLDFTLEFPRPLMPNVVLVGGISCDMRAPLPEDLESWVSGEHGFVVFTLGTMVSELPEKTVAMFLEAFRQIPQKVIWRYTGPIHEDIPENLKIMSWVPQNDLLAHPGVRAFITHAGSNGLFEGLCHAVPLVMLPLGGDQPDNAKRLASREVGVVLDIVTLTSEGLVQALNEVMNDERYKKNMQKLSALHNDRPMQPLDLAVYWTEFVMRHKGAKHLKSAVHTLNFFQYFSLDVIAFLATIALVFCLLTITCVKLCFRKLSRKRKQD